MSEQAPMSDDAYVELFKLEKLFEARFSLRSSIEGATDAPESPVAAQVACCHDSLEASVLLRPTDPGFSVANIGGESGIRMRLRLHRSQREAANKQPHPSQPAHPDTAAKPTQAGVEGCGTAAAAPVAAYVLQQASDIDIGNAAIAHDVKLVIKKVMLTFMTKYKTSQKYAVYECLKFLDRELCRIFELYGPRKGCAASNSSGGTTGGGNRDAGVADVTWSLQEQKCLEYALTKSKDLGDPAQRWAAVAKVVKTKTPEECRRRFQRCREQLLTKANEEQKAMVGMPKEFETVLARSEPLRLLGLEMEKISVFTIVGFTAQMACSRCETVFDMVFSPGAKKTALVSRSCDHCKMAQRGEFLPQIAFATQAAIGKLSLENCVYRDFIVGEFYITCEDCDTQCKVRDVQNGSRKRSNCRGCFAKLSLGFNTAEFGQEANAAPWVLVLNAVMLNRQVVEKPRMVRVKAERPKTQGARGLKVGTPLPDNGACKHYKKSFRWFRFPCCGKLFPCDMCHDAGSDHPYELAHVVVCGHCSTQQPVSNKKCRNCERGYAASTSAYWEGGKGCRDAVKLSRKDSKKYGLMRRQAQQTQAAPQDKEGRQSKGPRT